MSRLPFPIGLARAVQRAGAVLDHLSREVGSAVAWSWTSPVGRDAVIAEIYARQPRYLAGGSTFEGGLFAWELDAFACPDWPRSGKLLVGGAGGGREVRVLAGRGYAIRAFEPVQGFARSCADLCATLPDASCTEGSYGDLVQGVESGTGRLAPLVADAPFDAIVLGWGSLAHVTEEGQIHAVLAAARKLGPSAPLFTSFYAPETVGLGSGRVERFGGALGRAFSALGAPGHRPEGGVFLPWAGFVQSWTAERLAALVARHGYRIAVISQRPPQPWAMLAPNGS